VISLPQQARVGTSHGQHTGDVVVSVMLSTIISRLFQSVWLCVTVPRIQQAQAHVARHIRVRARRSKTSVNVVAAVHRLLAPKVTRSIIAR
jgi:hypothetical protein